MKTNKAAGLDCAITAEALQGGGDAMADVIHYFCAENMYSNLTLPDQWITDVIVSLPKKGDLSLMTNYRGISLLSIAGIVYNKILLNRIRDEVDPILRKTRLDSVQGEAMLSKSTFWEGSWKALEITSYLLSSALLTSQKPVIHQQKSHARSSLALWDSRSCSQCYQCALQKLKKRCDGGWKLIWSIWRHYWSPAGRCSGSFSICCAGWLLAENGHVAAWLWSCNPSLPF